MKKRTVCKRTLKCFISMLMVISVMLSLAVPLNVSVFAEEIVAENSEIYAILYYIDPTLRTSDNSSINNTKNIELVFQKGDVIDPDKTLVRDKNGNEGIFSIENDATTYNSSSVPSTAWYSFNSTSSNQNIVKVDFKNRIKPVNINGWLRGCNSLTMDNILHKENLDTSVCIGMSYAFEDCREFSEFDFSQWSGFDTSNVLTMKRMFHNCLSLSSIDMSGISFNSCMDYNSMFLVDDKYYTQSNKAYRPSVLQTVKFGSCNTTSNDRDFDFTSMFQGCTALESIDISVFDPVNARTFKTSKMFYNCYSLKEMDLSKLYAKMIRNGATVDLKDMFGNCISLEKVSFRGYPHTFGYNGVTNGMFTNCKSLRELDLYFDRATGKNFNDSGNNIYAGLNEFSYITINDKWKSSTKWVPVKTTWKKVALAPDVSNQVAVGTTLEDNLLFTNYKSTYAGTWAAATDFGFNANGGTPDVQFVSGVKDTPLNYASEIETPTREGYSFDGWHKVRHEASPFNSGDTADQWTYYAHWIDHTYKLILNANGGYIPNSNDTRIEYDNIKYSELKKLDKDAFVNDDGKILVAWNTRSNGTGTSFAPDDSVSMLTATDGGDVTLYAIWYTPDATVSFDPQGGSAVADKHYSNLPENFGTLSDSQRTDYTFLGWYTEAEGGSLIEADTPVMADCTLYAHWQKNPGVRFDAGDGYFDSDSTKKTISKYYKYNSYIGVMPTPEHTSASFLGWFKAGSDTPVSSDFEVTEDTVLTAHWGYLPEFDTDGGILGTVPEYEAQSGSLYTITALPTISKENYEFLGWKHGDTWVWQAGTTFPSGGVTVDLAENNKIKAVWQETPHCTITLDANGGSFSANTVNPIKVYENKPIAALPVPVRDGYDFEGWYLGTEKQTIESTYTEDKTLTAKWTAKNRTVTFDAGDGTMDSSTNSNVVKTKTVKVANGKTIPSIPGANYLDNKGNIVSAFGGWYTQPNGQGTRLTQDTVIDSDVTYYAYWPDNTQTNDTYQYSYFVQWNTPSNSNVTDLGDRLVYHPLNKSEQSAGLKVYFQTKGNAQPVPAGGLKIKIPKYLFKDWNGNPITNSNAESGVSGNFSVDKNSDPDYYIYTNTAPLSGTDTVFTINYKFSPLNVNGGYIDENGYYHGGYVNDDIKVKIEVDMNGDGVLETDYTKDLAVEMHTKVDTSVTKFRSDVSLSWNKKWGAAPADASEYFYVTWSLTSNHAYANCSQYFQLLWDENTVRDNGTVVWADSCVAHGDTAGAWTSMLSSGSQTYTVVTKHRRDLARSTGGDQWATVDNEAILKVKWRSGYEQQFRTAASTTAYIPPGGDGLYGFKKNVPDMTENDKHFKHGGQELVINREAENMPKLPYEIYYTERTNSDSPSWNANTGKYTAPKRTMTLSDGASGDVVISSNAGHYNTDSWAASTALEDGDYYFDSLKITVTEYDASKLGDQWSSPYEHTILNDYGVTQVWVRKMNSDSYTLHKELVVTTEEATVSLPADTVGYKIVHDSEFYSTDIAVKTNLCLKPTAKLAAIVGDDIENGLNTLIKNKAEMVAVCGENTRSYSSDTSTWPCTYVLDLSSTKLYARKSCASSSKVEIDTATRAEISPVLISGWSYNNSGNKNRFTEGEFYDLLPKDFYVDKNTVFVKPILENLSEVDYAVSANSYNTEKASGTLSKGSYRVSFEDDWQGSGRTLMKVSVHVPDSILATGVHVFFKMSTLYAGVYTNGTTQMNMAAFKDNTDTAAPPEKRMSTLEDNAIDPNYRYCFTQFDSDKTAFASANTDLHLPPIHESGVDSIVHADMTAAKHHSVGLNSDYSYYVTYGSGVGAVTTDMVFYDVIEHVHDGEQSDWYGTFKGIDVSSIAETVNDADPEATCAPVVWYAVKPKDSFVFDSTSENDDYNLTQNTFWTTTPPADLSEVTAVAVDCRLDSKGNPFKLSAESTIGFNIYMHSVDPSKVAVDIDAINNTYTYNEAIVRFSMDNLNTRVTQRTVTDVLLRFTKPSFVKQAFPESGTEQDPAVVVQNSVLEYTLKITNPDTEIPMNSIAVSDTIDAAKVKVIDNDIRVRLGDSEEDSIGDSVYIDFYELTLENGEYKFSAVINSLDKGEAISIIIPVTVVGAQNTKIQNTAEVTSVSGADISVISNTTYHIVDNPQVKILKVNSKNEPMPNAQLQILNSDSTPAEITDKSGTHITDAKFTSGQNELSFSISPGRYILHEIKTPDDNIYKYADDIVFRIDTDGFAYVDGIKTDCVKMMDVPAYKVIFHENKPGGTPAEKQKEFRIYEPSDLTDSKVTHFYDIPKWPEDPQWAEDEYVFAGWYSDSTWSYITDITIDCTAAVVPLNFEEKTFTGAARTTGDDPDYHFYAKWIKVGTVTQDDEDQNRFDGTYRGFGIAGVQIRPSIVQVLNEETGQYEDAYMYDPNIRDQGVPGEEYNNSTRRTPEGMRFVTSLSEDLLSSVNGITRISSNADALMNSFGVEYGYAVGTEANIKNFTSHYNVTDPANYPLQYNGTEVNGKDTTGTNENTRSVNTDFRFISNVDCTSKVGHGTKNNNTGVVKWDHRNYDDYRLYTLVVTYEDEQANKSENLVARAYMRYYDGNGKLRVFYNTYKQSMYSGCMCSFDRAYRAIYG